MEPLAGGSAPTSALSQNLWTDKVQKQINSFSDTKQAAIYKWFPALLSMRMILTQVSEFNWSDCPQPAFYRSVNWVRKPVEALISVQLFQNENCWVIPDFVEDLNTKNYLKY